MEAPMPRCAVNTSGAFDSALFGSGETAFAAQRRAYPSSFEFATDDDSSAPLGAPSDAMHYRRPHAAHYLFNSMPCAYAWFYH
jgi:hypothetical protein